MASASSSAIAIPVPQPTPPGHSVSKKHTKDELLAAKSKLLDQDFAMSRFADPLAPRLDSGAVHWPKGVTPEIEARWLARIEELKEKQKRAEAVE